MAITFPLVLPKGGIQEIRWANRSVVGVAQSPYTLSQQVQAHPGKLWMAAITIKPLTVAQSRAWAAFFLALNGREGTFLMGDPDAATPRGRALGSPVVEGGGQTGGLLTTSGWAPLTSGVLLAGDVVGLGSGEASRMHMVLEDVDSDAAGLADLPLWPTLREIPADGAAVVTRNAMGVWRMADGIPSWVSKTMVDASFSCVEAL